VSDQAFFILEKGTIYHPNVWLTIRQVCTEPGDILSHLIEFGKNGAIHSKVEVFPFASTCTPAQAGFVGVIRVAYHRRCEGQSEQVTNVGILDVTDKVENCQNLVQYGRAIKGRSSSESFGW